MDKSEPAGSRLTIPQWCAEDKPREKYAAQGPAALSDAELLAILLRTGTSTESAVDLSRRILHTCNNQLNRLEDLSLRQLTEIHGIGQAKAITLKAAFELGRRLSSEQVEERGTILSSSDAAEIMQERIGYLQHEEFWVLLLNQAAQILDTVQIGKGGLAATTVDPRVILHEALLHNATSIILCHNHPSGSLTPSKADILLTKDIQKAAALLNIKVLDHLILHKNKYYSFLDNEKL